MERVADALYRYASQSDIEKFASQVLYALAIGNLDMHAKNIGLLHLPDEAIHLAPAYDIPPLAHHGRGENLAFRVDGVVRYPLVTTDHIIREFLRWEVRPFISEDSTKAFIIEQFESIAAAVDQVKPYEKAYPGLVADVKSNIRRFLG